MADKNEYDKTERKPDVDILTQEEIDILTHALLPFPKDYSKSDNEFDKKYDSDKAIADYGEAIRLKPNCAEAYFDRGWEYYRKRSYNLAIADYSEAIRLKPNYTMAYYARGNVHYLKYDYDRAIADYSEAIRFAPSPSKELACFRGYAYRAQKDYDRAIADYSEAIRLDPNYAKAYNARGITAYSFRKDYDRAIMDFSEVIRLEPDCEHAYTQRGLTYMWKGNLDRAIADFEATLQIEPNNVIARQELENATKSYLKPSNESSEKNDPDKTIADYTEAIRLAPNNRMAYCHRGSEYYNKRNQNLENAEKNRNLAIADYTQTLRLCCEPYFDSKIIDEVFSHIDSGSKKQILITLENEEPNLARQIRSYIRERLFMFEDIVKLNDKSVQTILKQVDSKDLVLALKGVNKNAKNKIFSNMSERAAIMIKEEMQDLEQTTPKIEKSQWKVFSLIEYLKEAGELSFAYSNNYEISTYKGENGNAQTNSTMNKDEFIAAYLAFKNFVLEVAKKVRHDGLLSLEGYINPEKARARDIFHYGLSFILDGTEPDDIEKILSNIIEQDCNEYSRRLKTIQMEALRCIQDKKSPKLMHFLINSYTDLSIEYEKGNEAQNYEKVTFDNCEKITSRDGLVAACLTFKDVSLDFAKKARREGILSLEDCLDMEKVNNRDILHYGLQLTVDGTEGSIIRKILTNIIEQDNDKYLRKFKVFLIEAILAIYAGTNPKEMALLLDSHIELLKNEIIE
jgi:tetratricopeptide (TPR) repeat protein/flagellar motor component MotA